MLNLILQLIKNFLMESPVDGGIVSLSEVQNSVSGVDHDPPSTLGASQPPIRGSRNHGASSNRQNYGMKTINRENSYEELPNMEKSDDKSVENCLQKNISAIETKLCIDDPVDDSKNCDSSGVLESDSCILPSSSECVSVDKSVESGEVTNSGEFNESRKTSIYRESTGSDVSDESSTSSLSSNLYKPHKANDVRWEAIQAIRVRDGALEMRHFRLLKKLGCGDIGSVYLAELSATKTCFAMKVMNKTELASRKKLVRAQTEREILQSLDHPFLPSLYTHFETETFSCLVMEFCPGGDLHALRQRQPGKYFSEHAARLAIPFFSLFPSIISICT